MTLTIPAFNRISRRPADTVAREARDVQFQTLCVVLAFVGLGYALRHTGGRERGAPELGMLLAAPSVLVGRVWRRLSLFELVLCSAIACAAVLLPLITPLGVSMARDLNAYTYAVVMYLAIRGFTHGSEQRRLVAVGILCLGVVEFLDVIRVWIGEHDPTFQVVGTFYWHNQFGAFAVAIALLASAMAMRSRRAEDSIAWLVAPLFFALAWLSHSRGSLLALLLTAPCLLLVALLRRHWWAAARFAAVLALAFAAHSALIAAVSGSTGPPGYSPGKDSLSATSVWRLAAGEEAMRVFARAPLVSHGYGSLGVTGWRQAAAGTTTSPFAHSAEAQALSDGGVLLGLPVIVAVAAMALTALRRGLRSALRPRAPDLVRLGACLAVAAMLLHTSMDFDTQYPVLVALLGVFVALSVRDTHAETAQRRLRLRVVAVGLTASATVLGGLLVASYWHTTQLLSLAASQTSASPDTSVAAATQAFAHHRFPDPRPATFIVQATDVGLVFDQATLKRALRDSRSYAQLDPSFRPVWERVNAEVLAEWQPTAATTTSR